VTLDVIGVAPAGTVARHARIFGALQQEWPVRFVDAGAGETTGLAARIDVGLPAGGPAAADLPTLSLAAPAAGYEPVAAQVALRAVDPVDRALQGQVVREEQLLPGEPPGPSAVVLATADERPVWTWSAGGGGTWAASAALPDLGVDGMLRAHLRDGSFLGATALIHFLRAVAGDRAWVLPPPRATFVFDDPNLHASSYGYIRYPELAAEAREHGYHAVMATVPLDGWYLNRRATRIFREHADHLSLTIHGNNHLTRELGQPMPDTARAGLVAQALARVESMERRSGLHVSRVMVPPHGSLAEGMAEALRRSPIEAACLTRAYAWRKTPPPDRPLTGCHPADVAQGLPVISRLLLTLPRVDLAFRIFLGQPAVVYGHHDDLAGGLGLLAQAAEAVGRCGPVRWGSLTELARQNYAYATAGSEQRVRPFSRRIELRVPEGVRTVRVDAAADGWRGDELVVWNTAAGVTTTPLGGQVAVAPGERVELRITAPGAADRAPGTLLRLGAHGRARRVLTESRDRLTPLRERIRRPSR
jgi:hypothetical protein